MEVCAKCSKPLEVEVSQESDSDNDEMQVDEDHNPQTVPDDVKLSCGCHFHWECLLESYELANCPNCSRSIVSVPAGSSSSSSSSTAERVIVDLTNEGGMQSQIDIFPILKEESYLRAYPEERKSRAFLEFCREGDHRAIADLLKRCAEEADEEEEEPTQSRDEILRYQDPICEMESGLHAACANGHREVAWMLLWLASSFPELDIPALVFQEAATLGMNRESQEGKVDIRSLKDAHGRTAEDIAKEYGVVWTGWIGNGRLAMPR